MFSSKKRKTYYLSITRNNTPASAHKTHINNTTKKKVNPKSRTAAKNITDKDTNLAIMILLCLYIVSHSSKIRRLEK